MFYKLYFQNLKLVNDFFSLFKWENYQFEILNSAGDHGLQSKPSYAGNTGTGLFHETLLGISSYPGSLHKTPQNQTAPRGCSNDYCSKNYAKNV